MIVFGLLGIVEVRKCLNPLHFVKIVLAPKILTPTELVSVGAPQHQLPVCYDTGSVSILVSLQNKRKLGHANIFPLACWN